MMIPITSAVRVVTSGSSYLLHECSGVIDLNDVSAITGLARSNVNRGEDDLDEGPLPDGSVRRKGGGPKSLSERDPTLVSDLQRLAEPATMGDPMRPLKWVSKSPAKLAASLNESGHEISPNIVAKLLETELEYSRQVNRKTLEGASHPDRNGQFEHINAKVVAAQAVGQPVISVDPKKKELIGNFKNGGSDYRPKGDPRRGGARHWHDVSTRTISRERSSARSCPTASTMSAPMQGQPRHNE